MQVGDPVEHVLAESELKVRHCMPNVHCCQAAPVSCFIFIHVLSHTPMMPCPKNLADCCMPLNELLLGLSCRLHLALILVHAPLNYHGVQVHEYVQQL